MYKNNQLNCLIHVLLIAYIVLTQCNTFHCQLQTPPCPVDRINNNNINVVSRYALSIGFKSRLYELNM